MTSITLEIPDELAGQLAPFKNRLSQIVTFSLDWMGHSEKSRLGSSTSSSVLTEFIGFLATGPSQTDIIDFKVSQLTQDRLEELLDRNREGDLTPYEKSELDSFSYINHLIILLKAQARAVLSSSKENIDES